MQSVMINPTLKRQTLALAIASAIAPTGAGAADVYWNVATGNWAEPTSWSGGVLPTAADTVFVNNAAGQATSLNVDDTTDLLGPAHAGDLIIETTNIGSVVVNQTGGHLSVNGNQILGDTRGGGNFGLLAGNNNVNNLIVGAQAGGGGFYTQEGGILTANSESIGVSGSGYFNQGGGSNTITAELSLGGSNLPDSQGTYILRGGNLTAAVEKIGDIGTGTFYQYGGVNSATNNLRLGENVGSTGSYTLEGGELYTAFEEVGTGGSGSFEQSGGLNHVNNLTVGSQVGSNGSFNLSGTGNLSTDLERIGFAGNGTFKQSGGTHTVRSTYANGGLILGEFANSSGNYELSGAGQLTVAGNETIGQSGTGSFVQKSGAHTVAGLMTLGQDLASNGSYDMQAGNLTARGEQIGILGIGNFTQNGGNHIIGDDGLTLGSSNLAGSQGNYILNSGNLDTYGEAIGQVGVGTFVQNEGSHTVHSRLALGSSVNSQGSYTMSSGTLSFGWEEIGGYGTGKFVQSGGYHITSGLMPFASANFALGVEAGSQGSYELSGTGVLVTDNEVIGKSGNGSFVQKGGNHTVSGAVKIGQDIGSVGMYEFQGGTLTTQGLQAGAGAASFNWTGGNLHYTSDFTLTSSTAFFGHYLNMSAGRSLQVTNMTVADDGVVWQTGSSITVDLTLNQSGNYYLGGGNLNVGSLLDNNGVLTLAGGTVQSNELTNNALLTGYGTISANYFFNNGLFSQGDGNLTLKKTPNASNWSPFLNNSNMSLASGRQLRLESVGLSNYGTLDLNNGIVIGNIGSLTNNIGGMIIGRGTVSSDFQNAGGLLLVDSGTTKIVKDFTNLGVVQLNSASANLSGGRITNGAETTEYDPISNAYLTRWAGGTIQGFGLVGNSVDNSFNSTIEARGGTLTVAGYLTNTGTLTAASGSKLLVSQGLASNDGLINLDGGTFDNNGNNLRNVGQISGYGSLRSGSLSNDGNITLVNGNSIVNGNVTNGATGKVEISHNQALFTGDVVNNGTFKNTSGLVTFAGSYTENGLYYSDPAVNIFNSTVTVGENGYLLGGTGDEFHYKQNFIVHSLRDTDWNTDQAALFFDGGIEQNFYLAGADLGAQVKGFANNFSWGSLKLGDGTKLSLSDGNATSGAALYVHDIFLTGVDYNNLVISSILGSYNIYYDKDSIANAYLNGATFNFSGGGKLIGLQTSAVPLPASVWMFGATLMAWLGVCKRRQQRKSGSVY